MARLHHTTVQTAQPDLVRGFLEDVVGFTVVAQFDVPPHSLAKLLGWPVVDQAASATIFGDGAHGLLEVLHAPEAVIEAQGEGGGMPCIKVPDLPAALSASVTRGFTVSGTESFPLGEKTSHAAVIQVSDVRFELIQIA